MRSVVAEVDTWGQVHNVPRSAWVKTHAVSVRVSTDVAFAVLLAASVFTHALRGTLCTSCTVPRSAWVKTDAASKMASAGSVGFHPRAARGTVQGVRNVPRSAWVKTDAASRRVSTDAVLLAASVFTHALRGTFCTSCTVPLAARE